MMINYFSALLMGASSNLMGIFFAPGSYYPVYMNNIEIVLIRECFQKNMDIKDRL